MSVKKSFRAHFNAATPSLVRSLPALGVSLMVALIAGCGAAKENTSQKFGESELLGAPGNANSQTKHTFTLTLPEGCAEGTRNLAFDFATQDPVRDEFSFLMWAAANAYVRDQELATSIVKAAGFSDVTFFDRSTATTNASGFQGMLLVKPGLRVLALRGSDEDADWVANYRDTTRSGQPLGLPGSVHDGFTSQLESGWDDVSAALAKTDSRTPLVVTGHSLGAALATLFGARLKQEGQTIARVVAFAGPRVGDAIFSQGAEALLGSALVRVARADDFVTMAPPAPATADVGARIMTLGKTEEETKLKIAAFISANFRHTGRTWRLDGSTGSLERHSSDSDANDAAFLAVMLARKVAAGGDADKLKAIDADLFSMHNPAAYFCPVFMPK